MIAQRSRLRRYSAREGAHFEPRGGPAALTGGRDG
jgi:hypothetical protein